MPKRSLDACPGCGVKTELTVYTTLDGHQVTRVHEGWEHASKCRHYRRDSEEQKALAALVAEVSGPCQAPAVGFDGGLAEEGERVCGAPARRGIMSAWTCSAHRRGQDRNEIGGVALRSAFVLVEVEASGEPH